MCTRTRLEAAFADWAGARRQISDLRGQVASASGGGQGAQSPAAAKLFEALRAKETACAGLWRQLVRVDEELARTRAGAWAANGPSGVQGTEGARAPAVAAPVADAPVDVLIVDDETRNLTALEAVLDDPGYRIVRAATGEEALLALFTGDFACVLLDVQMPGMTGLEVASMIRQRRTSPGTPIILLTAYDKEEHHALAGYAIGAVDYVHKPFDAAVLRRKVDVFADLHRRNRKLHLLAAAERRARIQTTASAAAEASRRARFLASAAQALSRPLAFDDAIVAIVGLCVPMLGERAIVAVTGEGALAGSFEMHPPSDGQDDAWRAELQAEIGRVIRGRELRLWTGGGLSGAICPLLTGERPRGALAVLGPAADFDAARLELVRECAGRAAIALETARLNAQVHRAEQGKDRILSMFAHELRNPLAPISSAVQIIRGGAAPQSKTEWACDVISRQVSHMAQLIEDMLDVAELVQGQVAVRRETLTVASLVERAVEASAPKWSRRRQAITVEPGADPIEIHGDPVRLVQAISNVIDNASKFSGPESTIRITAARADGQARIAVQDAGCGIAPELLPHVFDLFAQAEQPLDRPHGGMGLGLTRVRHIVELHGGRVSARSDGIGKGAEVVIELPAR